MTTSYADYLLLSNNVLIVVIFLSSNETPNDNRFWSYARIDCNF